VQGNRRSAITPHLVAMLRREFALEWQGIHGAPHWARVRRNGLRIAAVTKASTRVVELFAFLHDARRLHDDGDREHGARAALLVRELGAAALAISGEEAELLAYACRHHSDGLIEADVTVQSCWDADRLDLGRVGIRPDPGRLCTAAAKRLCVDP
jgi:uncharacterized protein